MGDANVPGDRNVLDQNALLNDLSKASGLPRIKVKVVLNALAAACATGLKQGKRVRIAGLGTLHLREIPPQAGSAETRPPKRIVLSAAKQLKAEVFGE